MIVSLGFISNPVVDYILILYLSWTHAIIVFFFHHRENLFINIAITIYIALDFSASTSEEIILYRFNYKFA